MADAALKLEPTLCHGLVEAVAASLRGEAEAQGVKLVVAHSADDIVARTDRRTLGLAVRGLVSDAIARVPHGAVHISVLRVAAGGRRWVEISVAEIAGAGEEGRNASNGPFDLARTQKLAAQLGGRASIHCRAGEGSTYVLQIPEN